MCHQCLYKQIVRLFQLEKYNVLTAELHCPVRSFDEKIYIRDTCINIFLEMPCQVVFNKMSLGLIPDELMDFKNLNFQENM